MQQIKICKKIIHKHVNKIKIHNTCTKKYKIKILIINYNINFDWKIKNLIHLFFKVDLESKFKLS